MGTYANIRDAILTDIKTITGYGVAYSRERYSSQWQDFLALFSSSIDGVKQIRGWWITWDGIPELGVYETFTAGGEKYVYTVRGIQGLDDSANTEATFYNMVEAVKNKLRLNTTFGCTNAVTDAPDVTVPITQLRQFGSVLCHYCEIKVEVFVMEP